MFPEHGADERVAWRGRESIFVFALLALVFAIFQLHLGSVIISDMDEGTYLYAGQLISSGLVPYRDFLLAHPPLVALFSAGCYELFGPNLMAARVVYLGVVLLATLPLYALAKQLTASVAAALLAVVAYTSGMLLIANMGRTVRLEPLMNAFLIGAVACRFLRPRSPPFMVLMGTLFGCALFVKAVAIVPLAMLCSSDLLWDRPFRQVVVRWAFAALGAVLVLLPALGWCLSQPHFVRDVLLGQVERPRLGLEPRMHYLVQNLTRYPPIGMGLVAALVLVVKSRDARVKSLALVALGGTAALVFAFRTFFNYYIVQTLPWIAVMFALAVHLLALRWLAEWRSTAVYALVVVLGLAAPAAYAEYYQRHAFAHVAGPQRILSLLEKQDGYMYSMYPAFALWTGRRMTPWYYQADSLVPRINGWIKDQDFVGVFAASTALVLYTSELDDYPRATEYVNRHFRPAYRDDAWGLWIRSSPP